MIEESQMSLQRMIELENQIDDVQEMLNDCCDNPDTEQELSDTLDELFRELNHLEEISK